MCRKSELNFDCVTAGSGTANRSAAQIENWLLTVSTAPFFRPEETHANINISREAVGLIDPY